MSYLVKYFLIQYKSHTFFRFKEKLDSYKDRSKYADWQLEEKFDEVVRDTQYNITGKCFYSMNGIQYTATKFSIYAFQHFKEECDCCDFKGSKIDDERDLCKNCKAKRKWDQ